MPKTSIMLLVALSGLAHSAVARAQSYSFAINQPQSTVSYTLNINAPFQTSPAGTCHIIGSAAGADGIVGNADDVTTGTRTIPGIVGGNTSANTPVNITAGGATAGGNSGTTPVHPTGGFVVAVNTGSMTSAVSGLSIDLLGGSTATIATTVSITYSTFRTRQPTCTIFGGFPINVPVGNATVSALTAVQTGPAAIGTLTPVQGSPGQFMFSATVDATIAVMATINGEALDVPPQAVQLPVTGVITVNGDTAALTGDVNLDSTQTLPGPTAFEPLAFTEPLCSGQLLVNIVIGDTEVHVVTNAHLVGAGTRLPDAPGNPVDFNGDGLISPDDLDDFITGYFSDPADPACDFDGNGLITPDDLDDYITAYFES